MPARRKSTPNNQLYVVFFGFLIVGVFIWWLAQTLNTQRVTTGSKAAELNDYSYQNSQTVDTSGGCNAKCDPVNDVGCAADLTCVDTALKGNPPDYRCRLEGSTESIGCCWTPVREQNPTPRECPPGFFLTPDGRCMR